MSKRYPLQLFHVINSFCTQQIWLIQKQWRAEWASTLNTLREQVWGSNVLSVYLIPFVDDKIVYLHLTRTRYCNTNSWLFSTGTWMGTSSYTKLKASWRHSYTVWNQFLQKLVFNLDYYLLLADAYYPSKVVSALAFTLCTSSLTWTPAEWLIQADRHPVEPETTSLSKAKDCVTSSLLPSNFCLWNWKRRIFVGRRYRSRLNMVGRFCRMHIVVKSFSYESGVNWKSGWESELGNLLRRGTLMYISR